MNVVGNKHQPNLKAEFRDLVGNMINSNRSSYHMYSIHRLLSLGLLMDFTFKYIEAEQSDWVRIELDLREHGKVVFAINTDSEYGQIEDEDGREVLVHFMENYVTECDRVEKRRSIFGI
ncbi:hypothetical protein [Bacillus phage vB_BceM_Bc431v3]|uniref:Uncharacterized protein n=1 Tax=Bacillus phage vB_BceM_Bc431v3 TaxID=1195072 RepID=M4HP47_9CAUD|nr:hypothetical protein K201_gp004 [Bacillus phage vB_BceM_Bc431v3]AFQ96312.1 hypothetical protein [Bacillus phage vB_BceM_Bc431v3]